MEMLTYRSPSLLILVVVVARISETCHLEGRHGPIRPGMLMGRSSRCPNRFEFQITTNRQRRRWSENIFPNPGPARPTGVEGTGWPVRASNSNADEPLLHIPTAFQKAEADPRSRGTVSYPDLVGLEVFLDGRNRSPPAPMARRASSLDGQLAGM